MEAFFSLFSNGKSKDISEETMEEYRMISQFDTKEIGRLYRVFKGLCAGHSNGGGRALSREAFMEIPCIKVNPLRDRICAVFGFDETTNEVGLDFKKFLTGVASFNSPVLRDHKLRVAFRLQDFDNDGLISKEDMREYLLRVTPAAAGSDAASGLADDQLDTLVGHIFDEASSDALKAFISFGDFQAVMGPTDFQTKLHLPL